MIDFKHNVKMCDIKICINHMKIRVFDDDLYVLKINERLHKNLQQVPHLLFSAL